MKKWMLSLLVSNFCCFAAFAAPTINNAEEITYDLLVQIGNETGETDHIPHFQYLFSKHKVRKLFEFGMNLGTKYFLDSCTKVISVEFVTNGYGPSNYLTHLNLYRDYANWIPVVYFSSYLGDYSFAPYKYLGSESVHKAAAYQCATHRDYSVIDDFYLVELEAFIQNFVRFHKIDVGFVNSIGVYNRGDLIGLLFGKVPVIVAHDTALRAAKQVNDLFGYSRVVTPEDYEEIYIPSGRGTTVWISKKEAFLKLIQELQDYAQSF